MNIHWLLAFSVIVAGFCSFNAAAAPPLPPISISCINEAYNSENMSPFYYIVHRHVLCSADTSYFGSDPVTVTWDFGNGGGISESGATVYKESGTYTITAYATNGTIKTWTSIDFYAVGYENIRLNCDVNGMTVTCDPTTVNISSPNSGTMEWGDGTFTQMSNSGSSSSVGSSSLIDTGDTWTFGEPISHTYANAGAYTVSLNYQSGMQRGTDTSDISVSGTGNQPPSIDISCVNDVYNTEFFSPSFYYIENRRVICTASTSDPEGDVLTLHWNFGDGSVTSTDSTHRYKETGTYTITAYVSDGTHDISTSIEFEAIGYELVRLNCKTSGMSVTCKPTTVNISALRSAVISWGDGTTTHIGSSSSSASSTSSASGPTTKSTGIFDDPITHTYAATGDYTIKIDYASIMQHGTDSTTITIDGSTNPAIDASISCTTDYINTTIPEDGPIILLSEVVVCSVDLIKPELSEVTIRWDAGDGSDIVEQTRLNHAYREPGSYTIKATISDGSTTAEFSTDHAVEGNGEPPIVTLECESQGHTVNCSIFATDADNDALSARVGWGDGAPEIFPVLQENVTHTYAADHLGEQPIFVTVFDGANGSTAVFSINLQSQPQQTVSCEYEVVSEWTDHFLGKLTITNNGTEALDTWDVVLSYANNAVIDQHWGAEFNGSNPYMLTPLSWNQRIMPTQAVSIGFIGTNSGGQAVLPVIGGNTCSQE